MEEDYIFTYIADCPLCKSKHIELVESLCDWRGKWSFECMDCGLESGRKETQQELERYWNKL